VGVVGRQFVAAAAAGRGRRERIELGQQALLYVDGRESQVMLMNRRGCSFTSTSCWRVCQVWKLRLPSRPWHLRPAEVRRCQSRLPELAKDDSNGKESRETLNRLLMEGYLV
jgi:hypothetical protein